MSRRERPAKPALTQAGIVEAALALLREDGLEAVSMRRVAQALDTGAASLYVYVRNRDDLLGLLLDTVIGGVRLPDPEVEDWRGELTRVVLESIDLLGRHRGLAAATMGYVPSGPNATRLTDSLLALLLRAGITKQAAAWAVDLIGLHVAAAGMEASVYEERGSVEADVVDEMRARFDRLDPRQYPSIAAMRPELTTGDGEQRARWQMAVLLNGILSTPADADRG